MHSYEPKRQRTRQEMSPGQARQGAPVQRQADAKQSKAELTGTASPEFGHDFGRIRIDPPPLQSTPWIQRQPAPPKKHTPAKFTPRPMKLEDVVKEMTGLGGPYTDLKA